EGALSEVGGGHVGDADEERPGGATDWGQIAEGGEGGQRYEDRDRDRKAAEALDDADSKTLVEGNDDRVRAEWITLVRQLRPDAMRESIRGEQMLGHVRVEAGAEDPEVALNDKWQRGGNQRQSRDRPTR